MTKERNSNENYLLYKIYPETYLKLSVRQIDSFMQLNLIKMESSPPAGKLSQDCFEGQIESGVLSAKDFISLLSPLRSLE